MFCIYCGATLPEGAKKCTLCGNPVVRPPEATAQPVSEPESESAPAPETPTEPAVEDISSNLTESLSEAEPTPEAEDTPSNNPDDEDIYSHSPTDFTEDISSGDALGDKPEGMEHEGTFTVSPTPEEISGPEPRVQPIEYTYNDGYAYEEYDEKPKKKRSFKWLFIVLPILIAIGATIGGIFWWYNAPMQKLTRALDAYDYSAAAQVLPTLSKDELASVSDQMQEYAQTVIDRYIKRIYVPCDVCKGKRYNRETLEVKYKDKTISDVLDMTVEEACVFFANIPKIARKLQTLQEVGLGYIQLGQAATTLSGGEAQRVKLANELARRDTGQTVYILDEPTTGLHVADVHRLVKVLDKLVDAGNTVIVIEHNLDVIKRADHIIDLGPEGGSGGGTLVTCGTPEEVAACEQSYTGQYLRKMLR